MLPATIHVRIIVLCLSKKRAAGHWENQINGIATRLSAAIRALQVCAEARWPRLRSTRRSAQRASTYAVWRLLPEPWLGHHVTRSDHPHGHRHANHVEFPLGVVFCRSRPSSREPVRHLPAPIRECLLCACSCRSPGAW